MTTTKQQEIINELKNNIGTEHYYKIPFSSLVYTDGINNLINKCGSYWLFSDLGIELNNNNIINKDFLIVTIEVKNKKGLITIKEDTNKPIIFKKEYPFLPDFPLNKYEFYLINKVFLLKSEY
jgi:hypothetical protein|tara:strand:- start:224 stop:592 length:369 start_codon:yes stop_codon:yes gene_type:complete